MELCVQTLMCGLNGTGVSTLLEARKRKTSFEGYGYGCGGGEVRGRLLVNAGDGLTRFCADRGVRLACIEAVLVTSLAPHCTAGLVSLLLALSSVGAAQITIIGPQGIQDLCASFGLIFNRRYPEVKIVEVTAASSSPSELTTQNFLLKLQGISESNRDMVYGVSATVELLSLSSSSHFKRVLALPFTQSFTPEPTLKECLSINLFDGTEQLLMLCYPLTCTDPFTARDALRRLQLDCASVSSSSFHVIMHTMILNADVMEFTQPYISIASHAAVSPKLFPPLVPALKSLLENPHEVVKKGEEGAQLYIELGNRGITEAVPFMVLSGQETLKKIQLSLISAHGRRHMLARGCLDSVEEAALKAKRHTSACFDLVTKETDNFSAATNIRLQLAKSKKRKLSSPPISHPSPQPFSSPPSALSGDLRPQFIAVPAPSPADVRVTLLGTGSATPSKHRSGSAILLQQTSSEGSLSSILLDVAESCVSQLFLACGGCETRFFRTLASIEVLWVSHHHADHVCGFPMLIEMLHLCLLMKFRAKDKPLYVITTPALWIYFNFVSGCSGVDNLLRFIDIQTTHSNCCLTPELSDLYFSSASSVLSISSIPVKHCRHSYGLVLQLRNNQRIVYSGDCRPSEQLALAGKGCDMLIHEATFGDDMADDAIAKRHCTRSEALIVARDMNAGSVLLTHFSQRYPRQPPPAPDIAADDKEDKMSFLKSVIFGLDFLSFYCPSQIAAAAAVTGLLACSAKENSED